LNFRPHPYQGCAL